MSFPPHRRPIFGTTHGSHFVSCASVHRSGPWHSKRQPLSKCSHHSHPPSKAMLPTLLRRFLGVFILWDFCRVISIHGTESWHGPWSPALWSGLKLQKKWPRGAKWSMKLCVFVAWAPFNGFSNSSKISDFPMILWCPGKKWKKHTDFTKKLRNHKKNGKTTKFTLW